LLLLEERGLIPPAAAPDVYAVIPDIAAVVPAQLALMALRSAGVRCVAHPVGPQGPASVKSQFRKADSSGARFALVFGADELALGQVAIKPLREPGAPQLTRPWSTASQWAQELRAHPHNPPN
jgi:histidyl-tRNA synthetase